jgi:Domain of unknown function (DUF3472)/Domain of unknown function (DUF5077)
MNNRLAFLIISLSLLISNCRSDLYKNKMTSIPFAGNSWKAGPAEKNQKIIAYFYTDTTGPLFIGLRAKADSGSPVIVIESGGTARKIKIKNSDYDTLIAGEFRVKQPGYQTIELQILSNSGKSSAGISDILVGGPAAEGKIYFIKNDFYFGRRGPSVHLRYDIPEKASDIVWFYNEITIPDGNDVEGSYFMANGFADGYFGIQVNSPEERRILFSVWSPYKSDNPGEIPDDYKVILLKKGEDVITGEFGNEGSGGQSFRKFMWKADHTYKFLLKGEPSVNNSTDYTAYFYAPENGKWELIASFRRPKTTSYLRNLYSFLENFIQETGNIARKGYYSNQWICDKNGFWFELSSAKFTADATARKESRLDYAGGVEHGAFFLKNCGFFNERTPLNTQLFRSVTGKKPSIDSDFIEHNLIQK